jgi:hypothetical protein
VDLEELRRRVAAEIDSYVYEFPDGMIGKPWSAEKVQAHLQKMRESLIEPYWAEVTLRDTIEQMNAANPPIRRCAIVANADGALPAFDPVADKFLLAHADILESYGVDGDAVGCFMAR